jgi:polar amino acid transport system permease protein
MGSPLALKRSKQGDHYFLWVGVFFFIVITVVLALYFSARQIDYTWRWYRIPKYFAYQEQVEIKAEIDGEAVSIIKKGKKAFVQVKGLEGTESYTVPDSALEIEEGDTIYYGDVLATYKKWRVGILLEGLWLTLKVSIIAIVFGILIGLFTGLARISSNPALKWSAITYIEMVRGSPLLVQIFIWYFVLGTLINNILAKQGIGQISALWFGVAALAGIQSIHRGQTEAARSLGMTYVKSMRHVILPQALRRILPPLAGQFISLIKDSSLLGIIAIRELTKATREVVTTSLQPFELWFVCALLYLVLTFSLSMLLQYLERRQLAV